MAEENYVEVAIRAKDDGAGAELDDIKARIAALRDKIRDMRMGLDDRDMLNKLDYLDLRLDEIDHKLKSPRLTDFGLQRAALDAERVGLAFDKMQARAALDEEKLREEIARTGDAADRAALAAAVGMERYRRSIDNADKGLYQVSTRLKNLEAESGGNFLTRFFGGNANIFAKIAAGLSPLLTAVLGLGGAFLGAGAGIAAFAAIAGPVIKNAVSATSALVTANSKFDASAGLVHTAITKNAKDLATYTQALQGLTPAEQQVEKLLGQQGTRWAGLTTAQRHAAVGLLENKDALKAMLPDQAKALAQLVAQGQAYNSLTPAQRAFAAGLTTLDAAWQRMQRAITPSLLHMAGDAMRQLGPILAQVGSIAKTAAPGIGDMLHGILSFIHQGLAVLAPAVRPGLAVLNALGQALSGSLLSLFRAMTSSLRATAPALEGFLKGLGNGLSAFIRMLGTIAKALAPFVNAVLTVVTGLLNQLTPIMGQIGKVIADALIAVSPLFPQIARAILIMARAFTGALGQALTAIMPSLGLLARSLASLMTAIAPVLPQIAKLGIAMMGLAGNHADAVRHLASGLAALAGAIAFLIDVAARVITALRRWWDALGTTGQKVRDLWEVAKTAFGAIVRAIETANSAISSGMHAAWNAILGFWKAVGNTLWQSMKAAWALVVNAVSTGAASVLGFMRGLPGRIVSALGDLGHLLYGAGQALLGGLLSGIESMVGSVVHAAASIGSSILGSIKGALGISSPSREGFAIGANLGDSVATGMTSRLGHLSRAAARLGLAALPAPAGTGALGGAGGWVEARVSFQSTGDPLIDVIFRQIRIKIRAVGGSGPNSVQRALGWVT